MTAFADSSYFLGLMHPGDQFHAFATGLADTLQSIVTTHYALMEVGSAFARAADRWRFLDLLEMIDSDESARVIAADDGLFLAAIDLFRRRPDKDWSLTDCTSFVVI